MIDPKKELFRWGPIDGKVVYIDPFVQAFSDGVSFFPKAWPEMIANFTKSKVIFICGNKDLCDNGEVVFKEYLLDDKMLRKHYSLFNKQVKKVLEFEKKINNKREMDSLDSNKLTNLFKSWFDEYKLFWLYGFIPELANWGGEQILKRELTKLSIATPEIIEKLSAPDRLSFYQVEELDLLKVKLAKDKIKALKKHQKRYYWLKNSYNGTQVLDVDYFKEELKNIKDAKNKIKQIKEYDVVRKRKEIIKKYKINKNLAEVSEKLAFSIWWQDMRKKYIFIANHITSRFLHYISEFRDVSYGDLQLYTVPEIIELLDDNTIIDIDERRNGFTEYYYEDGRLEYLDSRQSAELMKKYEINEEVVNVLKGTVVSSGKIIRGKVKILLSPDDIHKIKKGEILVAPMTSPDYIFAMRKASAIITDEGGITSHAAIVSRELGIPCIVGTKIATKILKDNDKVKVDTSNGVVRKI